MTIRTTQASITTFTYKKASILLPFGKREINNIICLMIKIINRAGVPISFVELDVVDDAGQSELNHNFMGCQGPTNILSFPEDQNRRGSLSLSADTFARECVLYGQEPKAHLVRLLAHGLCHLAGYGHGNEMDAISNLCLKEVMGYYNYNG